MKQLILKKFKSFSLIFLVFSFSTISIAQTKSVDITFPVTKIKLKNGMTVLLHEDHSSPLIAVQQWYRVGSKDEKEGQTGLAHFFEHLMFKGTKLYPSKKYEEAIKSNGGLNNAFTSKDYTAYVSSMPSGKLELILEIEADRMKNLLLKKEEISSEKEVVKEERRSRIEDSISGSLNEALFKTVFKVHSYKWPVLGYMKDLNAAQSKDFKKFYNTYYSPNNSILVITGDFDISRAKKLIDHYYGNIPAQKLPKRLIVKEPIQRKRRKVILKKQTEKITFSYAYPSVSVKSKDVYPLDILAQILGAGQSSRLYQSLIYKNQLSTNVSAYNYSLKEQGLVFIFASMHPKKSAKKAKDLINKEIYKIRNELISQKELQKAKNIIVRSYVDSLETISNKARMLGLNEVLYGDYSAIFKDINEYMKITEKDVLRVAQKYLKPKRLSIVEVHPRK